MTLSRLKQHENPSPQRNYENNFTCFGEYCSLINSLDQQRDVIQTEQDGKSVTRISCEVESRDRASIILKRLLLKSELANLEESGKMIHLRICQPVCKTVERDVPKESILMSQREHRLAFLELTQAEDSIGIDEKGGKYTSHQASHGSLRGDPSADSQASNSKFNGVTCQTNLTTCEMCYHVYRLLSHSRCLLADDYLSTPLGKIEEKVFSLNKIIEESIHIPQKRSSKRTSHAHRSPLNSPQMKYPHNAKNSQRSHSNSRKLKESPCSNMRKEVKNDEHHNYIDKKNFQSPLKNSRKRESTIQRSKRLSEDVSLKPDESNEECVQSTETTLKAKVNPDKAEDSVQMFHYNNETILPYTVLGSESTLDTAKDKDLSDSSYNLVVCQDLFDTLERMKIFLSTFVEQYPYHQILLWNYPGQAYTSFSPKYCLNNEFHAKCLNGLLNHIGVDGTNEFDQRKPFFLLGHGYGGSVACHHAAKCQYIPGLKGIYLINPLTFVDVHFASVMHDCRNVFSCSPETRPDLPMYFYSRFIFSKEYLNKVSTPLALNLYTAIHNPITVKGRVSLCDGVLNNVDLRDSLKLIKAPIISLHGKTAELVRPIHAAQFLQDRHQCSTIHGALNQDGVKKTILVMTEGGHELFQEKKKKMLAMIVELLTGYHNRTSPHVKDQHHSLFQSSDTWGRVIQQSTELNPPETKENNVGKKTLSQTKDVVKREKNESEINQQQEINDDKVTKSKVQIMLDPDNPCFERHQNNVYKAGSGSIYPSSNEHVKPQEYMSWRLKRNRKRLSRFQNAARVIQGSLRVYMAKTMIARLKRQRSALNIQRCYRGMIGRRIFKEKMKELWAAKLLQRAYRGALGRRTSYYRRISIQAQINIARVWRGHIARKFVNEIKLKRNVAAIHFQSLWRRCMAIDYAHYLRTRKQSSIIIQRVFRGHMGRLKAEKERDKYVFSKSQSMGIELGRKMLAEHKLRATRLQSELSVLEKERASIESKVESISTDLNRFQDNARKLEKSMHEISAVEAQKRFDVATQHAIRQKKVQLDEDFSRLLSKISDRKNQLKILEEKLSLLERNKREKKESLQKLERKLVAILEAQENELNEIKRKQDEKVDKIARTGVFPPASSGDTQMYSERNAVTTQQRLKTSKLMDSTETMMKFGFMSMAMTYFTSMNMVGAMKNVTMSDMDEINDMEEMKIAPKLLKGGGRDDTTSSNGSSQIDVKKWDVENVVQWLAAIYLSQYEDLFRDASIDGPFLCQLTDEDLKDALGIQHKLHRKKILFGIDQLKSQSKTSSVPSQHIDSTFVQQPGYSKPPVYSKQAGYSTNTTESSLSQDNDDVANINDVLAQAMEETKRSTPTIDQLSRWIRNQKIAKIKESLQHINAQDFDQNDVRVQFVEGVGTAYMKSVEDQAFHINKADEHGNTLMHVAAQNGNVKIAMFLINKGANPNHQNKQGQTPGHFAVSYQFFDFASWLYDPDGGKGNDLLTNIYGLGPYDGLSDG